MPGRIAGWVAGAMLGLAAAQPALAQGDPITAQTLIDRAEIGDLLTRYYYNLGHASPNSFAEFYVEDAQFVVAGKTFRGREQIEGVYKGVPRDAPQVASFSFNVQLTNPLIAVRGHSATAQVIFTEVVMPHEGDAPRIIAQGREFDRLVKRGGKWRFVRREVVNGSATPADWRE